MYRKNDLSKEFEETMKEIKSVLTAQAVKSSMSEYADADDIMTNFAALRMVNRLVDLTCKMVDEQQKLMSKMDKALDKYLESK